MKFFYYFFYVGFIIVSKIDCNPPKIVKDALDDSISTNSRLFYKYYETIFDYFVRQYRGKKIFEFLFCAF